MWSPSTASKPSSPVRGGPARRSVCAVHSVPALWSNSQPGENGAAGLGEYRQVGGPVGWLPARELNPRGLKIAAEAVHEPAGLAGDEVLGLRGAGLGLKTGSLLPTAPPWSTSRLSDAVCLDLQHLYWIPSRLRP
jgi:hypothetical protein